MKNSSAAVSNPQVTPVIQSPRVNGFAPWRTVKKKRISYLALPLIIMATMTEFIILATGWKYQKVVCLPQGMGVTFFGIGPIGATILAVELLKLPLAIWTASRHGWQKAVMLVFGLPMICLLTFQLVKDMAVYEMGIALTPASQFLDKAMTEEVKMDQLKGDLAAIQQKKSDRDSQLAGLAAKKAKSNADFEESLKRNDESRTDAISLTDYQQKELATVQNREANMIKQFDADTAEITKTIADLRARREVEGAQAARWNAEQASLDNAYKAKLADYTNKKAVYDEEKARYDQANFVHRQFMTEPVNPGVAPEPEDNALLKPTSIADIDAQIKSKEAELLAVNTQRRTQVAQVESDARALREKFDERSRDRRGEADRRRDELMTAHAALAPQWAAEERQINQDYDAVAEKIDGIRAALDDSSKKAEVFYEARETAIKATQVHRIATTVEIIRGLLMGQRPVSIKATAKERGDLYTDQISMVRIWVYPVLAFIVAFLPTLMVEIGFSTIFEKEPVRAAYRLGFLGRHLHWIHVRAGRQKIFRAERLAREAAGRIAARERALAEKATELQTAAAALDATSASHTEQLKKQENEWRGKLANVTDSLNRAVAEKDALVAMQESEVERQLQLRPNAWSDRLEQMRQEMDGQRASFEAERATLLQEQHKKLIEVTEDSRNQLLQARRQMADAFSVKLAQVQEDAANEIKKVCRQEKKHLEHKQSEFGKTLQRHEQELSSNFDARLAVEKARAEQDVRSREAELELELATLARNQQAPRIPDARQTEDIAEIKLKQRGEQLQAEIKVSSADLQQTRVEKELLNRDSQLNRELDAKTRETDARLVQELQRQEELLKNGVLQREAVWQAKLENVKGELQEKIDRELRRRESEMVPTARRALRELVPGVEW